MIDDLRRLAVGATLFVLACASSGAAARSKDGFVRETRKVVDHVYLVHRPVATDAPFEGNVTVIEQTDSLVVVDAGGAPIAGEHIVKQIRGISPKPVKALIYTHYHGDHNLGAGAIIKAWPGVKIISTRKTRENMTGAPMKYIQTYSDAYKGQLDFARKQLQSGISESEKGGWSRFVEVGPSIVEGYKNLKAWPAQLTFTDRLTLPDEAAPVEVMFLGRANTDSDAVVWLPRQRVVASGDIVVHPVPYAAHSFPSEWLEVLKKLKALDFAYLIPGHGEVQTDSAYLDKLSKAIEDVRAQVTPLAQKGLTLQEVRKQTNFDKLRQEFGGDDGWHRFLTDIFFIGAITKNAYQEAKGEPIIQGAN
jgi:glyoxylase-like metal-dependent hydrolase (beta-lactamase superfamily II)